MRTIGGLLIAVGVILAVIVAIWTRVVGYYQNELPAIAVVGTIACGGIFGGIALYRSASPNGPTPTAAAWRPPDVTEPTATPTSSTIAPLPHLDENASAEDLARLAAERPDLWGAIAAHPRCYPALGAWIAEASAEQPPLDRQAPRTDSEDEAWTAARVTAENPDAAPADLASIAEHYPDLRAVVALNPAAYPELREWISTVGRVHHG